MEHDAQIRIQLQEILAGRHSRAMADKAAQILLQSDIAFRTGLHMLRYGEQPIPQRISWALEQAVLKNKSIVVPYLDDLVRWLPELGHDAERRNMTKILAISPLPEEELGNLLDQALLWKVSPNQPPAVRAWCTDICGRIAQLEPELKREIVLSIRESMQHGSVGIKRRNQMWLERLETSASH